MAQTGREGTHYVGDGCLPPHDGELRAGREGDQRMPIENSRPRIHDSVSADLGHYGMSGTALVQADLLDRQRVGIKRYGTALQAFNGRNALQDLYDEILDGCVYARQALEEMGCSPLAVPDSPEIERFIHFTREERRRWNILAETYQELLRKACSVRNLMEEQ
jgi:hypothetical protein